MNMQSSVSTVQSYIEKYSLQVTTANHWQEDATVVGIHEVRKLIDRLEREKIELARKAYECRDEVEYCDQPFKYWLENEITK